MSITLTAAQCPIPIVPASFLRIADASGSTGNAPVSKNMADFDIYFRTHAINPNATIQDLNARYGGGAYAIAWGLTLSISGTALHVDISAGHAMIDGPVEVPSNTSIAISSGHSGPTDRAWIYLMQNGSFQVVYNSLTPPSGACCLLGSATTDSVSVTAVDFSGVMYLRGGIPYRQTADAGAPTDTPPSSVAFVHQTAFAQYLYTGGIYQQATLPSLPSDPSSPQNGDVWINTTAGVVKSVVSGSVIAAIPPSANTTPVAKGNLGTAATFNFPLGVNQTGTLNNNCTFTFTAPAAGSTLTLVLTQDSTGFRTVTWPASIKWPGGTLMTLSGPNKTDIVTMYYDGTNYFVVRTAQNF